MNRRIVVIGGGIAGLAAAHSITELAREKSLGVELTLLEATSRLGGSIATEKIGDFLVEAGPDSFITEKPSALRLCERIGLTPRHFSYSRRHGFGHSFKAGFSPGQENCAWRANLCFRAAI